MDKNCILLIPSKKNKTIIMKTESEYSLIDVLKDILVIHSPFIKWTGDNIQEVINNHFCKIGGTSKDEENYIGENIIKIVGNIKCSLPVNCISSTHKFKFTILKEIKMKSD